MLYLPEAHLCPECGHENDWWILYNFDKGETRESIIRALFLDSFIQGKEIVYDQVRRHIKDVNTGLDFPVFSGLKIPS